jgi:hypothetical protein
MRIINQNPGKDNKYQVMDPCIVCGLEVNEVSYMYGTDYADLITEPWVTPSHSGMFTFSPCGCKVPDTLVQGWTITRCDTKKAYNREVVRRAYALYTAKSGAFAKAFGASNVRLRANSAGST